MRTRRRVAVAAVAALAVAVAACGDDGPPVGLPTPATTSTPTSDATATTAEPAPAIAPPSTAAPDATDAPASSPSTAAVTTTTSTVPAGPPNEPRPALTNGGGESEAFSGIGRLDGLGSSCTAFLLDAGEPSGPAYAMTNGRCVGIVDSTTVVRDQPVDGATVSFGLFADTPSDGAEIPVAAVLYATMRGTDVAVLQLAATRSDVIGLPSYSLAPPPRDGAAIRVVGVPVDGVPADAWVLRGEPCTAGATSRLVELEWVWDAATSSDCAGILVGSSGSPVFGARDPSRVVGIVNTTTIGAGPGVTCALGQPCEVGPDGTTTTPVDRTYAMPVGSWDDCFTPAWDPAAPGCPVEQAPTTVDAPMRAVRPGATWGATLVTGNGGPAVVKAGPVGTTDCRDEAGYVLAAPPTFDEPLPLTEGVVVLSAAALDDRGGLDTAQAGTAVMVVDSTPPDQPITLAQASQDGGVRVEPVFAPPELSSFDVKVGSGVDCADPAGYAAYPRAPVVVPAADLPATLCVVGLDEAGNKGAPQSFELS